MPTATVAHPALQRKLQSLSRRLPPEVARFLLTLSFSDRDYEKIAKLSEKANEGDLSASEQEELEALVLLNDLLVILQSNARESIATKSATT